MKKPSTALSNTTTFTSGSVSIAVTTSSRSGSCLGPKILTGGMSKVTRQYDGSRRSKRIWSVVKVRSGRFMIAFLSVGKEGNARKCASPQLSDRLTQRSEGGAHFRGEQCGLLPGGEVAALVEAVVVHQLRIGLLGPAARRGVDLVREDADGDRDPDVLGLEEHQLVLPVQPRRRHRGVGEPVERDVVDHVVPRQPF